MALQEDSYGDYGKADFDWSNVKTGAEFGSALGPVGAVAGGVLGAGKSYLDKINKEKGYTYSSPWGKEGVSGGPDGSDKDNNYSDPYNVVGGGSQGSGTNTDPSGDPTTLYGSAQAGIDAQEKMRDKIKALYAPFYDSVVDGGLKQLQAMSGEGGEVDYTPSKLYEYSKQRGERNIRRTQAAKGQLNSSGTAERLSDFNLGLAGEEMDRLYSGQLSRVQLGAQSADAISSANQSLGSNVSGLYSNLGSGLDMQEQNAGEARQSSYQGLSSTLMGLAKYMETF